MKAYRQRIQKCRAARIHKPVIRLFAEFPKGRGWTTVDYVAWFIKANHYTSGE